MFVRSHPHASLQAGDTFDAVADCGDFDFLAGNSWTRLTLARQSAVASAVEAGAEGFEARVRRLSLVASVRARRDLLVVSKVSASFVAWVA